MTGTKFAALIREYTHTNSTTLTDDTILLLANSQKDSFFAPKISLSKKGAFEVPALANLVADQREYPFLADVLNGIVRVEAKFTSTGKFIIVKELDINKNEVPENEEDIVNFYSNDEGRPRFDIRRGAIYLYSGTIVNVTNGLRIFHNVFPEDLVAGDLAKDTDLSIATSTTTVAMPRIFHELWARSVSIVWKTNREKPIGLTPLEQKFQDDFDENMSSYKQNNTDADLRATNPDDQHLQY